MKTLVTVEVADVEEAEQLVDFLAEHFELFASIEDEHFVSVTTSQGDGK